MDPGRQPLGVHRVPGPGRGERFPSVPAALGFNLGWTTCRRPRKPILAVGLRPTERGTRGVYAGAGEGSLAGNTVIDGTNPTPPASSSRRLAWPLTLWAQAAAGVHVVKALHPFAGASWPYVGRQDEAPVLAICGDDPRALIQTTALIRDLGGRAGVVGGLTSARQVEEAAGFVMRIVAAGHNTRFAVPNADPALLYTPQATN